MKIILYFYNFVNQISNESIQKEKILHFASRLLFFPLHICVIYTKFYNSIYTLYLCAK